MQTPLPPSLDCTERARLSWEGKRCRTAAQEIGYAHIEGIFHRSDHGDRVSRLDSDREWTGAIAGAFPAVAIPTNAERFGPKDRSNGGRRETGRNSKAGLSGANRRGPPCRPG